jgi:hypothetical protein
MKNGHPRVSVFHENIVLSNNQCNSERLGHDGVCSFVWNDRIIAQQRKKAIPTF